MRTTYMKKMASPVCMPSSSNIGVQIELMVNQIRMIVSLRMMECIESSIVGRSKRRRKTALAGEKSLIFMDLSSFVVVKRLRRKWIPIFSNSHRTLVLEKFLCIAVDWT